MCDMLEALAVGSPNFVPVNKMVETEANEIENVITGIELICVGSCLNRECDKCETFNIMNMFEAVDCIDLAPGP